jgi:hypothetical protein
MIHQRERLPFGLETRDHLSGVHAELDDLESDTALHRLALFGHIDRAETALADLLKEFVPPDDRAGAFEDWRVENRGQLVLGLENAGGVSVNSEQIFDTLAQLVVASAGAFQETFTLIRRQLQRFGEEIFLDVRVLIHRLRLIEFIRVL